MAKARGIPPLGRTPNALPAPQAPAYLPMAKARGITQDLVTDQRQHRQDRLHEDAVLPLPPSTEFEIARIARRRVKGHITQDNHALVELPYEPLEGVIGDMRRGTVPRDNQAVLVHHQAQFT